MSVNTKCAAAAASGSHGREARSCFLSAEQQQVSSSMSGGCGDGDNTAKRVLPELLPLLEEADELEDAEVESRALEMVIHIAKLDAEQTATSVGYEPAIVDERVIHALLAVLRRSFGNKVKTKTFWLLMLMSVVAASCSPQPLRPLPHLQSCRRHESDRRCCRSSAPLARRLPRRAHSMCRHLRGGLFQGMTMTAISTRFLMTIIVAGYSMPFFFYTTCSAIECVDDECANICESSKR